MSKKKIKEELKLNFDFDKEKQNKIADDFCNLASEITGISKKEFEEFERKVRSGEIKLDNDI